MIRIKGFLDFTRINESENDYKNPIEREYPELWDEMKSMGFVDVSTPIMKKNGTIWLKNSLKGFNQNGYALRTKSGWVAAGINRSIRQNPGESRLKFQSIERDLSVEEMAKYVIDVYKRRKAINDRIQNRLSKYPELIENDQEIINAINIITKSRWEKNRKTGRYDIYGKTFITEEALEELKRLGIKIGKVNGDFFLTKTDHKIIDLENEFSGIIDLSLLKKNIDLAIRTIPSGTVFTSGENISLSLYSFNGEIKFNNRGSVILTLGSNSNIDAEFNNKGGTDLTLGSNSNIDAEFNNKGYVKLGLGFGCKIDAEFNNEGYSSVFKADNRSSLEGDIIFNNIGYVSINHFKEIKGNIEFKNIGNAIIYAPLDLNKFVSGPNVSLLFREVFLERSKIKNVYSESKKVSIETPYFVDEKLLIDKYEFAKEIFNSAEELYFFTHNGIPERLTLNTEFKGDDKLRISRETGNQLLRFFGYFPGDEYWKEIIN